MSLSPLATVGLLSSLIASADTYIADDGAFSLICGFLFVYESTTGIVTSDLVAGLAQWYSFREYGLPKSNTLEVYRNHVNELMFQQFHR